LGVIGLSEQQKMKGKGIDDHEEETYSKDTKKRRIGPSK